MMKNIAGRIEEMLIEVAFAEEREISYLKNISGRFTEGLDNRFTAMSFAEAGEFDMAADFMSGGHGCGKNTVGYCLYGFCGGRA